MKTKHCKDCKKEKPLKNFYKHKGGCGGYRERCKKCISKRRKELLRAQTPEQAAKRKEKDKRYRKENKGRRARWHREWRLRNLYGLTPEEYNYLFEKQNGCCIICGIHQSELNEKLDVEHSHDTGEVRGLACRKCNLLVGKIENNLELIDKILEYING